MDVPSAGRYPALKTQRLYKSRRTCQKRTARNPTQWKKPELFRRRSWSLRHEGLLPLPYRRVPRTRPKSQDAHKIVRRSQKRVQAPKLREKPTNRAYRLQRSFHKSPALPNANPARRPIRAERRQKSLR